MALKNYEIHREIEKGELKKTFGYALILAVFFTMVLFYISQSIVKVRLENEINRQVLYRNRLLQNNQKLRVERGFLSSFPKIETEARNRLGLIDYEIGQLIILNPEALMQHK